MASIRRPRFAIALLACLTIIIFCPVVAQTSGEPHASSAPEGFLPWQPLAGVVAITAGGGHTCVVVSGGNADCWGVNYDGELGDGTTVERWSPTVVAGLPESAKVITARLGHTCAVTTAGAVWCWGENYYGLLGDGTAVPQLTPVPVVGSGNGNLGATTGAYHTCALSASGAAYCWGDNEHGELGTGTKKTSFTPVAVINLGAGVQQIAAGEFHTCAVTAAGGVKCWGSNNHGQLGNGNTADQLMPVQVTGLTSGVIGIAAGDSYTCVVTGAGDVLCWGDNASGQLGDGTKAMRLTPTSVNGLAGSAKAISAAVSHTCAVTGGGGVLCWGDNASGQLGDGTLDPHLAPNAVVGLSNRVVAVAEGSAHTCALTVNGTVECWGANGSGRLGDGTNVRRLTPVRVMVGLHLGFFPFVSTRK